MPSSLVRSLKLTTAGIALGGVLCLTSVSQATVYTGSATDPSGDLGLDVGDFLPSPPVDFTHVSVRYDDVAGRVDVSYSFSQAPASYQGLRASVALGFVEPDGSCSTPTFTSRHWHGPIRGGPPRGQVAVEGRSFEFVGSVLGTVFNHDPDAPRGYVQEGWERTALFDWPGSEHTTWNFATIHPSLVRDPYPCARAAVVVGGTGGVGVDSLESDVLDLKRAVPAAPSAQWLSPKEGQTVSGKLTEGGAGAQKCQADVTGPVVRTENYVDGRLNDTQVNAPWGCEWDTRNYVNGGHQLTVKAYDVAGNVIAADTVNVVVNNPNPPVVNSPPAPTTEPGPVVVVVVPSGDPTPTSTPAPRFTGRMARGAAKKALARRYGRAFRLRRDYTANCEKISATRWSCAVRWRYGSFVYKGKINLALRHDGRIATRIVLRRTIR